MTIDLGSEVRVQRLWDGRNSDGLAGSVYGRIIRSFGFRLAFTLWFFADSLSRSTRGQLTAVLHQPRTI